MKRSFFYNIVLIIALFVLINEACLSQTYPWQKITSDISVFDIIYGGQQNIYFSGNEYSNSYFYKSEDFGVTWTRLGDGSLRLYRLAMDSTGVLWGGSDVGGIYTSTDQGEHWVCVLSSNDKIICVTVSPQNWIWAGTTEGKVIYSSDHGISWNYSDLTNCIIWSINAKNPNFIFAGNAIGQIFKSADEGVNWQIVYNDDLWLTIGGIVLDSANVIYASVYNKIVKSTDNGDNWTQINAPGVENLYMDLYHKFYGAPGYGSTDNCQTWTFIGPQYHIARSFCFGDSLIFTGTSQGVFFYDPSYHPYIGSDFMPLHIGNKWQFNQRCNHRFAGNFLISIDKDTVISDKRYYHLQGDINDWVRYDTTENIFYVRWNDSDYTEIDFKWNAGTEYQQIWFNYHYVYNSTVLEPGTFAIFDSSYFSRSSRAYFYGPINVGSCATYYSESLGITHFESYGESPGGQSSSCSKRLTRGILMDSDKISYYSDGVGPIIGFQPVYTTNNFNIDWNFTVDHNYTYFSQYWDENFIDTVLLVSYYSNGDSALNNSPVMAENEPQSINYNLSFSLDSVLVKKNYSFFYRIYAVDKGIVPEAAFQPDTGYYELVYDSNAVRIQNDYNKVTDYSLDQNYPNPFNPATTIGFGIPKKSNVKITILNVIGEEVAVMLNEEKEAGYHQVEFNAANFPSGVYFYQLKAGDFVKTKKMILMK